MKRYISLLRGINVSGQKKIKMAELRALYESIGFADVQSYLQSGNVVFATEETERTRIAQSIAAAITATYGFTVTVLIQDATDFAQVFAGNPFLEAHGEDLTKLYVTFLVGQPSSEALANLALPANSGDEFAVRGQHVYIFCPGGYGRTKLSNAFFERKLKVTATTRNWRTVTALTNMIAIE